MKSAILLLLGLFLVLPAQAAPAPFPQAERRLASEDLSWLLLREHCLIVKKVERKGYSNVWLIHTLELRSRGNNLDCMPRTFEIECGSTDGSVPLRILFRQLANQ